jgi:hypothetical protein
MSQPESFSQQEYMNQTGSLSQPGYMSQSDSLNQPGYRNQSSSLSQPYSPKLDNNYAMNSYYGNLSQPNMISHSPLVSPVLSPIASPVQSKFALPTTTTNTFVKSKAIDNGTQLFSNSNEVLSTKKMISSSSEEYNSKINTSYVSPSETPTVISPVLKNNNSNINNNNNNNSNDDGVVDNEINESLSFIENLEEEEEDIDTILNRTIDNIVGTHRGAFQKRSELIETISKRSINQYKEFQLQSGKKSKVFLSGQMCRWTEEDPFSIFSDDVIRFSTSETSKIQSYEQRREVSFEKIITENNGYWQECNFLITSNELIIFPNGKWDNKVIEVMTFADDINITISSILFTKSVWVIEITTAESNVYSQSNPIAQKTRKEKEEGKSSREGSKNHDNNNSDKPNRNSNNDDNSDKLNRNGNNDDNNDKSNRNGNDDNSDKKDIMAIGQNSKEENTEKSVKTPKNKNSISTSTPLDSSRLCRWIIKFYDRDMMFYFISIIKYTQTKLLKNLMPYNQLLSSSESDSNSEEEEQSLLDEEIEKRLKSFINNEESFTNGTPHHYLSTQPELSKPTGVFDSSIENATSSPANYSNGTNGIHGIHGLNNSNNSNNSNDFNSTFNTINEINNPTLPSSVGSSSIRLERKSSLANDWKGRPRKSSLGYNYRYNTNTFANVNIESGKERRTRLNSGPSSIMDGYNTSRERNSSLAYLSGELVEKDSTTCLNSQLFLTQPKRISTISLLLKLTLVLRMLISK